MSLFDVMMIITMFSFVISSLLVFTVMKGIGFKNMFRIFKLKMKIKKGWGQIKLINQTGVPEIYPYQFEGAHLLEPIKEHKYIYKSHCVAVDEYNIPTITYRKDDADPINPKTGLQTVTSAKAIDVVIAKYIKAENTLENGFGDFMKKNWMKIGIGIIILIGGFLFLYMHMTDAIVAAAQSSSQTIVLNSSQIGR